MLKKIRENKALNIIGNLLYSLLVLFVVVILIVVMLQRFSNNNIALGGYRIFNIISESMVPEYEIGDILIAKVTDASELKTGDNIAYMGEKMDFAGKIVTHKIEEVLPRSDGKYNFITKGLANDVADPEITEDQVLGKVIYKVASLSFISKMVNNLYSMYFLIFIPIAIIIFVNVRRIYLNILDSREEKRLEKEEKLKVKKENENKEENKEKNEDNEDIK